MVTERGVPIAPRRLRFTPMASLGLFQSWETIVYRRLPVLSTLLAVLLLTFFLVSQGKAQNQSPAGPAFNGDWILQPETSTIDADQRPRAGLLNIQVTGEHIWHSITTLTWAGRKKTTSSLTVNTWDMGHPTEGPKGVFSTVERSDDDWLVRKEVTLPNGTKQKVVVRYVYPHADPNTLTVLQTIQSGETKVKSRWIYHRKVFVKTVIQ